MVAVSATKCHLHRQLSIQLNRTWHGVVDALWLGDSSRSGCMQSHLLIVNGAYRIYVEQGVSLKSKHGMCEIMISPDATVPEIVSECRPWQMRWLGTSGADSPRSSYSRSKVTLIVVPGEHQLKTGTQALESAAAPDRGTVMCAWYNHLVCSDWRRHLQDDSYIPAKGKHTYFSDIY